MRSANDAIGIGSVVGMALLYVVGGIGVGLFFMLRQRWVLWRQAAMLGRAPSACMQTLAAINELPLLWMNYDTAIPRVDFPRAAGSRSSVAGFVGFSVFFALVVHGGGNPDAPRVPPPSAVLARVGAD